MVGAKGAANQKVEFNLKAPTFAKFLAIRVGLNNTYHIAASYVNTLVLNFGLRQLWCGARMKNLRRTLSESTIKLMNKSHKLPSDFILFS